MKVRMVVDGRKSVTDGQVVLHTSDCENGVFCDNRIHEEDLITLLYA